MLNPRDYLEDCVRFSMKDLYATGMPWHAVNAAIDTRFNYTIPDSGMAKFVAKTGHNWDNAEDTLEKKLQCPRCSTYVKVPWTSCGIEKVSSVRQ